MESLDISGDDQGVPDLGFDEVADHVREVVRASVAPAAEHLVPLGASMVQKMHAVADELGKEDAAEGRLLDGFDRAIHDQPSALGAGVDLAPIKAVEPGFDASDFRTLARETFIKIREARGSQRAHAGDGLLSPTMERELNDVIDGDVAAHRHHILALLDVIDATIVSANLDGAREKIGMRFVFGAEEIERDAATEAVVSDDHRVHRWAELWQFARDSSIDPSATDQQHILSFGPDRWLFAHRGWVVTEIKRLEDAVHVAQPGLPQPGLPQPGMAQPGSAQPGMAQPGSAQPGMAQPGMAQPGMAQPGSAQPGMAQPGSAQPGSAQPGGPQPGQTRRQGPVLT